MFNIFTIILHFLSSFYLLNSYLYKVGWVRIHTTYFIRNNMLFIHANNWCSSLVPENISFTMLELYYLPILYVLHGCMLKYVIHWSFINLLIKSSNPYYLLLITLKSS